MEWVAYPFSKGSSQPRNWTGVSCIAGGFFTNWPVREALCGRLFNILLKKKKIAELSSRALSLNNVIIFSLYVDVSFFISSKN